MFKNIFTSEGGSESEGEQLKRARIIDEAHREAVNTQSAVDKIPGRALDREKIIAEAYEKAAAEVRENPAKKRRLEFGGRVARLMREAEDVLNMHKDAEPEEKAPEK